MRLDAHFDMLPERAFEKRGFGRGPATLEGGKGGGGSAPAPDPNIGLAQKKLAELSEQQYNDFKTIVWPEMLKQSQQQQANADAQTKIATETQAKQNAIAEEQYAKYKETYQPLQDQIVTEAKNYDTEANRERIAQGAMGDVTSQFGIAQQNNARQMASYGIDPTSGRYQGQMNQNDVMQAATGAAAATRARDAAVQLGWAKKMDAAGMASGQFGNQATATGLGLNAGGSAVNAGAAGMNATNALGAGLNAGYSGSMSGWGQVGQLGVSKYNTDVSAFNAQNQANATASAGWGSAIGAGIGAWASKGSDIRTKENIEFVGRAPNGLAVYSYEYKPEFKDRKHFGHGKYQGYMAHEVQEVYPDAISYTEDGYKLVDYSKVH